MDLMFFVNNLLLGVGLAMDAFSVSIANGLSDKCMTRKKGFGIAGVFAGFQTLMPLLGWVFVHTLLSLFEVFSPFIPWVALVLLLFIGGKMIYDSVKRKEECCSGGVTIAALLVQGVATSIDALSVGFTIAEYEFLFALVAVLLIGAVTFIICSVGVYVGKTFGAKLSDKAGVFGGIILIAIGIEIFLTGVL
ncbi:MAG: manganese efflux pump [Clostridia bacterium]|nr:manganese efflux pump [Clostridia bacterium]